MSALRDVLIFTDLDGTLLDHETYSWKAAEAALDVLRVEGAGVVLASSKTAAEIAPIRDELGFPEWPAIVENGGGFLEPGVLARGTTDIYQKIRQALSNLPHGFLGFGDMTAQEVSDCTGLSLSDAKLAQQRRFSEPGLWMGDEDNFDTFLKAAQAFGLTAQRGGRFTTLSFGGTKADRVAELKARFSPDHTIVLGDAPNDIDMFGLADTGVIVANPASPDLPKLPGEDTGRIRRTTVEGPEGWAEAILDIVQELTNTKDRHAHG